MVTLHYLKNGGNSHMSTAWPIFFKYFPSIICGLTGNLRSFRKWLFKTIKLGASAQLTLLEFPHNSHASLCLWCSVFNHHVLQKKNLTGTTFAPALRWSKRREASTDDFIVEAVSIRWTQAQAAAEETGGTVHGTKGFCSTTTENPQSHGSP